MLITKLNMIRKMDHKRNLYVFLFKKEKGTAGQTSKVNKRKKSCKKTLCCMHCGGAKNKKKKINCRETRDT